MSLVQMSLYGAVMIVAICGIRSAVANKIPKAALLILWDIALIRLLVPFVIPSQLSVYTLLDSLTSQRAKHVLLAAPASLSPATSLEQGSGGFQSIDIPWAVLMWGVGAAALFFYYAAVYWKCRREFQAALPIHNAVVSQWQEKQRRLFPIQIKESDRIDTPLTYGILHPVILMPKGIDWDDVSSVECILYHESAHIRRLDSLMKLCLALARCIHWFNPIVWLMSYLANQDIELSCDETVINRMGEKAKRVYALTLIKMEAKKSGLEPLCSHFSENSIEERIVSIMNMKKTSLMGTILTIAVIAGTTTAFATSAKEKTEMMKVVPATLASSITADEADGQETAERKKFVTAVPASSTAVGEEGIPAAELIPSKEAKMEKIIMSKDNGNNVLSFSIKDGNKMTAEEFQKWMETKEAELNQAVSEGKLKKEEMATQMKTYQDTLKEIQNGTSIYLTENGELITFMTSVTVDGKGNETVIAELDDLA